MPNDASFLDFSVVTPFERFVASLESALSAYPHRPGQPRARMSLSNPLPYRSDDYVLSLVPEGGVAGAQSDSSDGEELEADPSAREVFAEQLTEPGGEEEEEPGKEEPGEAHEAREAVQTSAADVGLPAALTGEAHEARDEVAQTSAADVDLPPALTDSDLPATLTDSSTPLDIDMAPAEHASSDDPHAAGAASPSLPARLPASPPRPALPCCPVRPSLRDAPSRLQEWFGLSEAWRLEPGSFSRRVLDRAEAQALCSAASAALAHAGDARAVLVPVHDSVRDGWAGAALGPGGSFRRMEADSVHSSTSAPVHLFHTPAQLRLLAALLADCDPEGASACRAAAQGRPAAEGGIQLRLEGRASFVVPSPRYRAVARGPHCALGGAQWALVDSNALHAAELWGERDGEEGGATASDKAAGVPPLSFSPPRRQAEGQQPSLLPSPPRPGSQLRRRAEEQPGSRARQQRPSAGPHPTPLPSPAHAAGRQLQRPPYPRGAAPAQPRPAPEAGWDAQAAWRPWAAQADPVACLELDLSWRHARARDAAAAGAAGFDPDLAQVWRLAALDAEHRADDGRRGFALRAVDVRRRFLRLAPVESWEGGGGAAAGCSQPRSGIGAPGRSAHPASSSRPELTPTPSPPRPRSSRARSQPSRARSQPSPRRSQPSPPPMRPQPTPRSDRLPGQKSLFGRLQALAQDWGWVRSADSVGQLQQAGWWLQRGLALVEEEDSAAAQARVGRALEEVLGRRGAGGGGEGTADSSFWGKAAPRDSPLARLALQALGARSVAFVARLWTAFLEELRLHHWEAGFELRLGGGDGDGVDLGACLAHQKLQVLAICIAARKERGGEGPAALRAAEARARRRVGARRLSFDEDERARRGEEGGPAGDGEPGGARGEGAGGASLERVASPTPCSSVDGSEDSFRSARAGSESAGEEEGSGSLHAAKGSFAPPGQRSADPAESSAAPSESFADPAESSADPAESSADPAEPSADPAEPSADLAEPSADPAQSSGAPSDTSAASLGSSSASASSAAAPTPSSAAAPASSPAAPASPHNPAPTSPTHRHRPPRGVLSLMPRGTCLLRHPTRRMRVPRTQRPLPLSEDLVLEQTAVLGAAAASPQLGAAVARHGRSAERALRSDMAAFKAANPGCVFADFVRWHSPRDWVAEPAAEGPESGAEPATEGPESGAEPAAEGPEPGAEADAPRHALSRRMSDPQGRWQSLWRGCESQAAAEQRPLFDPELEGEAALHVLETLPPAAVWAQLLACGASALVGALAADEAARRLASVRAQVEALGRVVQRELVDGLRVTGGVDRGESLSVASSSPSGLGSWSGRLEDAGGGKEGVGNKAEGGEDAGDGEDEQRMASSTGLVFPFPPPASRSSLPPSDSRCSLPPSASRSSLAPSASLPAPPSPPPWLPSAGVLQDLFAQGADAGALQRVALAAGRAERTVGAGRALLFRLGILGLSRETETGEVLARLADALVTSALGRRGRGRTYATLVTLSRAQRLALGRLMEGGRARVGSGAGETAASASSLEDADVASDPAKASAPHLWPAASRMDWCLGALDAQGALRHRLYIRALPAEVRVATVITSRPGLGAWGGQGP